MSEIQRAIATYEFWRQARIVEVPYDPKACGVCGNKRGHYLHRAKAEPPKDYSQSPHKFVAIKEAPDA